MEKLGLLFKNTARNRIKDSFKEANTVLVIGYSNLSSPDVTTLRQSLKNVNAEFLVVKNTVAQRALKESGAESLIGLVSGPCGLIFVKDDPVAVSKVLFDFARDHEHLKLHGGSSGKRFFERKDLEAISRIPSKTILRAQFVMILNSPISRLVTGLKQNLTKLVYCLDQIKNKKTK